MLNLSFTSQIVVPVPISVLPFVIGLMIVRALVVLILTMPVIFKTAVLITASVSSSYLVEPRSIVLHYPVVAVVSSVVGLSWSSAVKAVVSIASSVVV